MIYVAITAAIIAVLYIILLIMYSKVFVNKDKYADYKTFLLNHTTVKNCMRDFTVATIALLPLF